MPDNNGSVAHLAGSRLPAITLTATDGHAVALNGLGTGRTVLYVYPMTGRPGVDLPEGWDEIPGARGCTPEACGFRDHHELLREAGAARLYGLSSQTTEYQQEAVDRLHLPFPMLSDPRFAVADALALPSFALGGIRYHRRLTMIVNGDVVEQVFYPVISPGEHAAEVLAWLRDHPPGSH